VQCHVRNDDRFGEGEPAADVEQRAQRGGSWKASAFHHVAPVDGTAAHHHPGSGRYAELFRNGDLDPRPQINVETVEPRGREAGEYRGRRQASPRSLEPRQMVSMIHSNSLPANGPGDNAGR
jgi:hypothetical protein